MPLHVDAQHAQYEAMLARWERLRDCYAGEDAVKAKKEKYLPYLAEHHDKPHLYDAYLDRAVFFNATKRTANGLNGSIFQNAPTLTDATPDVEQQLTDITLTGQSLDMFALDTVKDVILVGRAGVMIDMPPEVVVEVAPGVEAPPVAPVRPFVVRYDTENIINWRTTRRDGHEIITLLVLREFRDIVAADDRFTVETHEVYRVLELDGNGWLVVSVFEQIKNAAGEKVWVELENHQPKRRGQRLDFIPFVFLGPTSVQSKVEDPPLDDLAVVNISHYRTMADLEHGRHLTALPTPYVTGAFGDDDDDPIYMGSSTCLILPQGAEAGMIEFQGTGLEALVTAEKDKRTMMATVGARMLESDTTQETLGAVAMRHSGEHATLRTVAQTAEQAFTTVLQIFTWLQSTEALFTDVKIKYELNKEFFSVRLQPAEIASLVAAWVQDGFSYETLYFNLERGGVTRPGITAEDELTAVSQQKTEDAALNARLFPELAAASNPNNPGGLGSQPPPAPVPTPAPDKSIRFQRKNGKITGAKVRAR